jgi:hypothetical protein
VLLLAQYATIVARHVCDGLNSVGTTLWYCSMDSEAIRSAKGQVLVRLFSACRIAGGDSISMYDVRRVCAILEGECKCTTGMCMQCIHKQTIDTTAHVCVSVGNKRNETYRFYMLENLNERHKT